jgi:hypothetical protein
MGCQVGVLVGSLAYIVVVFMLHVFGKLVSFGKK